MRSPSLPPPRSPLPSTRKRPLSSPKPSHDAVTAPVTPPPAPTRPLHSQWQPLHVSPSELSLHLTLPTGQTFRWRRTGPDQYTGPVGPHLLSLRHDPFSDRHLSFRLHSPASALPDLRDYLNLDLSLVSMWRRFAVADPRFAELAARLPGGARVLRQDPLECIFQFLCSSNNNIARIEKMVEVLSRFGAFLGSVDGFDFYRFPNLDELSVVSEQQLRQAGFGYRAKYIVGAVKALQSKPGGGSSWLASLRELELPEVIKALCTLPGVGPKVAACIALFSLDQHHAIPVDTHVWQIATRYFLPELAGTQLTPKHFGCVSEAFVTRFGEYAGWAQTAFFIAELPSLKGTLLSDVSDMKGRKPARNKRKKHKVLDNFE